MNVQAIKATQPQQVNFKGNPMSDGIATVLGKVGNSDTFVKGIEKVGKSPNLVANLSTASSAVTTGLYVYKTLTNDKMDKKEKLTLALNQALTFVASTAIQYTILGALKNTKSNLVGKFAEAVTQRSGSCANSLQKGAEAAVDLVVCSSVNRYLSPVAVTPIANKLGDWVSNKLAAKQEAQKA